LTGSATYDCPLGRWFMVRSTLASRAERRDANLETETMGRVVVEATIENANELWAAEKGLIPADQVQPRVPSPTRSWTPREPAFVADFVIRTLGLIKYSKCGVEQWRRHQRRLDYASVRLTVQGRDCFWTSSKCRQCASSDRPGSAELLDFVVDPRIAGSLATRARRRANVRTILTPPRTWIPRESALESEHPGNQGWWAPRPSVNGPLHTEG